MPLRVVDGLEVVDVDQQQAERSALPGRDVELARELVLEGPMVAETGEPVEQGVEAGAVVELHHLGPLGVDRRRVTEDPPGDDGHERRQADAGGDEDEDRRKPVAGTGRAECLDRRNAHQADEGNQQGGDEQASDRLEPASPPPRRRW